MNKHLKLFANHSAYSQAESNLDKPNVVMCQQENEIHFNPDSIAPIIPLDGEKLKVLYKGSYVVGYAKDNTFSYYITNDGAAIFNSEGVVVSSEVINSDFDREISISLYYGGYDFPHNTISDTVILGQRIEQWSEFKEVLT